MVSGSIGDIFVRLGIDPSGLSSGFDKAESTLESLGNKFFYMGARLTAGITVPLVAAGAAITKWGLEFDKAMTESLAIMNGVTPKLREQMEETAKTVSETTKFSAEEAAEAYYDLASAGLTAAESMGSLDTVARFAQAGVMDLGKSGEYLAGSVAAVGEASLGTADKISGMKKMADIMTQANNFALGTVEDFAKAISNKAGQAMRMYNISIEEGTSVLMAYAEQNIRGAVAGTQFWMVTRDIQRAVRANSDEWKKLGIQVYDAQGNMNNMGIIIRQMENAFHGLSDAKRNDALASLGLQDRSKAATLALIGMSSEIFRFQAALNDSAGAMERVARNQMDAIVNQLLALWHQFQNVGITIFAEFVPVLRQYLIPAIEYVIAKMKEFSAWLKTLSTDQKAWILGIMTAAAALGPLITALGSFLILLRAVTGPFQILLRLISGLASSSGFSGVVKALFGMTTGMKTAETASQRMIAGMSAAGRAAAVTSAETAGATGGILAMGRAMLSASTWTGLFGRALSFLGGPVGIAVGLFIALAGAVKSAVGGWGEFYNLLNALTLGRLDETVKGFQSLWNILKDLGAIAYDFGTILYNAISGVLGLFNPLLKGMSDVGKKMADMNKEGGKSPAWLKWLRDQVHAGAIITDLAVNGPGDMPTVGPPKEQERFELPMADPEKYRFIEDPFTGMISPLKGPSTLDFSEADEEAKKAAQRAKELMEQLSGAEAIKGAQELMKVMAKLPPIQNLTKDAQKQINETLFKALQAYSALGTEAPAAMRKVYTETYKNVVLPDMLAEHARDMKEEMKTLAAENLKFAEAAVEANKKLMDGAWSAMSEINQKHDAAFKTSRERQIDDANKWSEDMFMAIRPLADKYPQVWNLMADRINEVYSTMTMDAEAFALQQYRIHVESGTATIGELERLWDDYWKKHLENNHKFLQQIIEMSTSMSKSFRDLARVASGAFKDILIEISEFLEAVEMSSKGLLAWKEQQEKMKETGKVTLANILAMTGALIQMAAAFWEVTGAGSTFKRTLGGIITGTQMGRAIGSIFGPMGAAIGTAVGAIAGGLTGLFRGLFGVSDAENKGRETAAGFRQGLLDGLSKTQLKGVRDALQNGWEGNKIGAATVIAVRDAYLKLGKTEAEALDVVDRLWAAEKKGPEAVKKVIEEIQSNLDRLTERTENAALFATRLGEAFQYVNDNGRLANKQMLDAMRTAQELGGASEQLAAIMEASFSRAFGGMIAYMENMESSSSAVLMAFAGNIVAMVQVLQDQGLTMLEIVEKIKPVMEKLREEMKAHGLEGTEAFASISRTIEYMSDEVVVKAIEAMMGLNDVIIGLHNSGLLNQETFSTLGREIVDIFNDTVKKGYDADTVMKLIAPSLQTMWELMTDFGFTVDAATQSLIDQGLAAGIIGEDMRDDNEALKSIMEDLVAVMQDFVDEMRIARGAAVDLGAAAAAIEFPPMPDYQFPDYSGAYQNPDGSYSPGIMDPSQYSQSDIQYPEGYVSPDYYGGYSDLPYGLPGDIRFAEGAYVTGPTPAWVGEGAYNEFVAPEPMLRSVVESAVSDDEDAAGPVTIITNVYTYSSAEFDELIDDKLVPGVLTAFRRNRRGAKSELRNLTE